MFGSTQVQANVAGFEVGVTSWTPDYTGDFSLNTATTKRTVVDIQDDLEFNDESHRIAWVKLEHPVPILPNFKNWINLDTDLTIRQYDGAAEISTSTTKASEDPYFVVPLIYVNDRIDMAFSGFFIESEINTINADNNSISDLVLFVGYESDFGLGGRLGVKTLHLELDESDMVTDLEFDGAYLNLFYHF